MVQAITGGAQNLNAGSTLVTAPANTANGNEIATMSNLAGLAVGVGQTWQDLTASRAINTNYTNSTGRPITIAVSLVGPSATSASLQLLVNGVVVISQGSGVISSSQNRPAATLVIPNGAVYRAQGGSGSETLFLWSELR